MQNPEYWWGKLWYNHLNLKRTLHYHSKKKNCNKLYFTIEWQLHHMQDQIKLFSFTKIRSLTTSFFLIFGLCLNRTKQYRIDFQFWYEPELQNCDNQRTSPKVRLPLSYNTNSNWRFHQFIGTTKFSNCLTLQ